MVEKPVSKNFIPISLQTLTIKELHILTGIPLYLLEGFSRGEFKPNLSNREKLSIKSLRFYKWNEEDKKLFLQRRKYHAISPLMSEQEKDELNSDSAKYAQRLDALVDRHWNHLMKRIAEKCT